jgi:Fe-S-cluster containining protein
MFRPEDMNGPSAGFAQEHWQVTAERPAPEGSPAPVQYLVTCDQFDPETRMCTAHDDRPPICSGYPWYGAEPNPNRALDPQCSFIADVRTLLPIVEVR